MNEYGKLYNNYVNKVCNFIQQKKKALLTFGNSLQNTLRGIFHTLILRQPLRVL